MPDFDRSKTVAVDFETTGDDPAFGLQPWRVDQQRALIRAMSVASYDAQGKMQVRGCLDPTRTQICAFLRWAAQTNTLLVGWNTPFDVSWMIAYDLEAEVWACRWCDAMLLWMHREREPEYDEKGVKRRGWSLEEAILQYNPEAAVFKQIEDFHTTDPKLLQRLLMRNKMDAACTLRYAEYFWNDLTDKQQKCAVIEAASIPHVARANYTGMGVDLDHCATLDAKLKAQADEHLLTLSKYGATPKILASPQQLAKLMYEGWGLPILKTTGTGQPSTDKETLFELAPSDSRANLVKEYREANNNRTKFVANIIESAHYNDDGMTRPGARIHGTYTERMTYSSKQGKGVKEVQTGFAIAQMKREKEFRQTITAPEGYVLAEWDARSQEFRLMGILSGDPVMLGLCEEGEDAHAYMGAAIGRVDYRSLIAAYHDEESEDHAQAKILRKGGKFANLSFQYRIGVENATIKGRVQYELDVDEAWVAKVKKTYMRSYSKVETYWETAIHKARKAGYAETLGGCRVQLKGNWNGRKAWSLESTAINMPIQGTGADQKYLALACVKPVLQKYGAYFGWDLHDGLYFYLRQDNWQKAAAAIDKVLQSLPYKRAWDVDLPIALPFDCKIGPSWGDLKEYHF